MHQLSNVGQHFFTLQITSPENKNGILFAPSQVLVARVGGRQLRSEGGCNKADDTALRDIVQECNNNCPEISRNANITADSLKLYAEPVQKDTDK